MRSVHRVLVLTVLCVLTLGPGAIAMAAGPDASAVVRGNSAFAVDLYGKLAASEGNLFFSPYSVSTALAMTYAGARGNTEKEMAKALRFSLDQARLHPAFADLQGELDKAVEAGHGPDRELRLRPLLVANSLWPQDKYKLQDDFLALTKRCYGVSVTPLDYEHAAEQARGTINKWIADNTGEKIKDLIPTGVLDASTRLVLANAVYFKGRWKSTFKVEKTKDAPFTVAPGKQVTAAEMTQHMRLGYAKLDSMEMLELPYAGGQMSMIVLLPTEADGLKKVESSLTAENFAQWRSRLRQREVTVCLPKFKLTSTFRLDQALRSLGMGDAFDPSKADFSGMDGKAGWLYVGAVLHKAFVEVNEEGTEAAAATVIPVAGDGEEAFFFNADHPFLFLIQENATGSILFLGRVTDPTKT